MNICSSITKEKLIKGLPASFQQVMFGMGCFWGAEKLFWQQIGVQGTAVGYAGGHTEMPTYQQVCSDTTGHVEVVLVIYDPKVISFEALLRLFWENHNPTEGERQGNDIGSQYRSVIFCTTKKQLQQALTSKKQYQQQLTKQKYGIITTDINMAPTFYFAEDYHQKYLIKNPNGYCGLKGTGVHCTI